MMRSLFLCSLCRTVTKQSFLNDLRYIATSASWLQRRHVSVTPKDRFNGKLFKPKYRQDRVKPTYDLVYVNSHMSLLWPCRIVTNLAAVCWIAAAVVYTWKNYETIQNWELIGYSSILTSYLFHVAFFNWISKFYVKRIYFNPDIGNFIGILPSIIGQAKHIKYSGSDVRSKPSKLVDVRCNVVIRGREIVLRAEDFLSPHYYNMHMYKGYHSM